MGNTAEQMSESGGRDRCNRIRTLYFSGIGMACFLGVMDNVLSLESSMNVKEELGTATALLFGVSGFLMSIFVCPFILQVFKPKTTLIIGEIAGTMYTVANFYPNWYTLSIGSILLGFGEITAMVGSSALVASIGTTEKNHTGNMGVFAALFSVGQILVGLATELGFKFTSKSIDTNITSFYNYSKCGSNDCPAEYTFSAHADIFAKMIPSKVSVYVLLSIYLVIQITGIAIHWFGIPNAIIDTEETESLIEAPEQNDKATNILSVWKKTLLHTCCFQTLLVLPVQFLLGLTLAFFWTEFTRGYVSCTIGADHIGISNVFFFLFAFVANLILERLKKFGIISVMVPCLILSVGVYTACLVWVPTQDNTFMLDIIAGLLGVLFGTTILSALLPSVVYFLNQPIALCIQTGMMSLGYTVSFSWAVALCVYVKLYFLITFGVFANLCWAIAHVRYRKYGAV